MYQNKYEAKIRCLLTLNHISPVRMGMPINVRNQKLAMTFRGAEIRYDELILSLKHSR